MIILGFSQQAIEDSINKGSGLLSGESFDDLQSLVDGDLWRDVVEMFQLGGSDS